MCNIEHIKGQTKLHPMIFVLYIQTHSTQIHTYTMGPKGHLRKSEISNCLLLVNLVNVAILNRNIELNNTLSIYPLSISCFIQSAGGLELIPAVIRQEPGDTLDGSPGNHKMGNYSIIQYVDLFILLIQNPVILINPVFTLSFPV